ncbi:MAG: nitroreductase [Candidatus Omnitrophica bacterium CG07_land_8_20_14_0_80_42_15]|uniref:Nitroreductase n=1 Tax=Candidatus Aquitaenariimonas noxiae TaxID=1974741 RepID=A0A2J0KUY9_9BACT|nr:MAG: nitroreductase [Candidatus Omnitrophica bacterium CG07_land_8_20_14_0_80_42_15]
MKRKPISIICLILSTLFIYPALTHAQEMKPIKLLPPQLAGSKPLMEVLQERKSEREFSSKELPLQILSDLLWAADGINRPGSGKRTAPTAMNLQEIDIYVAKTDGLYLYDAKDNALAPVLTEDVRAQTGSQIFVKNAPINLIFVADFAKMGNVSADDANFYSATDTGYISQNVYLYCASAGLVTVVRGWVDRPALVKVMKLRPDQKIILAQTVGYPKE